MSFVYPRVVSINRANTNETPGAQSYSGTTEAAETVILSSLPAAIQLQRKASTPIGGLPSDASNRAGFNVFIPKRAAALGLIKERDVVVDDLGNRYQVFGAYWNSLGYNLFTELLQA